MDNLCRGGGTHSAWVWGWVPAGPGPAVTNPAVACIRARNHPGQGARDDAMRGLVAWAAREAADLPGRLLGAGQLAALARCDDEAETLVAALIHQGCSWRS